MKKILKSIILSFLIFIVTPWSYGEIIVDGLMDDWKEINPILILDQLGQRAESPGNWQGPDDLSGLIYFTRDTDYIYLLAKIRDDKPMWNPREPSVQPGWWKTTYDGDALRIKLTSSLATSDLFLFPGAFGINPKIYIYRSTILKTGILTEGEIISSYLDEYSGYLMEIKLNKSNLGLGNGHLILEFELFDGDGIVTGCKSLKSKPISIEGVN